MEQEIEQEMNDYQKLSDISKSILETDYLMATIVQSDITSALRHLDRLGAPLNYESIMEQAALFMKIRHSAEFKTAEYLIRNAIGVFAMNEDTEEGIKMTQEAIQMVAKIKKEQV